MLRDVLGNKAAEDLVDSLEDAWNELQKLGYKEMRPWQEFFATFKPPQLDSRHLEQRMTTNFLHYRSNYFVICLSIVLLQILLAPMIIFAVILIVVFCTYLLQVLKKPLVIGDIVLDEKKKSIVCAVFSLVLLVVTGTLERLIWCMLYCITLCGLHMLLRPRSVMSKSNKVYEELKLGGYSWFGGSSSSSSSSTYVSGGKKSSGMSGASATASYEDANNDPERGGDAEVKEEGFSSNVDGSGTTAVRKRGAAPSSSSGGSAVPSSVGGSSITGLYEVNKKD